MNTKTVYLIKIRDKYNNRIYKGKDNLTLANPLSYQLMDFANNYGFDTKYDAVHAPISFFLEGEMTSSEIVPLEVFHD